MTEIVLFLNNDLRVIIHHARRDTLAIPVKHILKYPNINTKKIIGL